VARTGGTTAGDSSRPTLVLTNCTILLPDRAAAGSVVVSGERIAAILAASEPAPEADRVLDLGGATLAPGFVDLHIHGSAGVDVLEADDEHLDRLAAWLASRGVTRFVPTLVALGLGAYREPVERLAAWMAKRRREPAGGAVPAGIHFEGPFLNAARCGALDASAFLDGTRWRDFVDAVGPATLAALPARMITVAPEIRGGIDLVRGAVADGFVVSIGHTEAGPTVLDAAVDAGARHMTHFMNAMPAMHHRDPGPVGWQLARRRASVDVVADFEHVHPDVVGLVVSVLEVDRVALISDAIPPAGLGDGAYSIWGETIRVSGHRTANARGSIAGSVISMADAVRNVSGLGVDPVAAARMASTVPARVLGDDTIGAVAVGKIADLVALGADGEPVMTVVAGRAVFEADAAA
jgi:N-acetylglucosamine-6-phosphate deacetylase